MNSIPESTNGFNHESTNGHNILEQLDALELDSVLSIATDTDPVVDVGAAEAEQVDAIGWMDGLIKKELLPEALKRTEMFSQLTPAEFDGVCAELLYRGVSQTSIKTMLQPAVKAARPKTATRAKPVWSDYVQAANELGYLFRINDMNDDLEVNGKPMTDTDEAVLLSYLDEKGLSNAAVALRALVTSGSLNRYHPIKEYFESLAWDGDDHIAALASYVTDAHDPITYQDGKRRSVFHAVMNRWFTGAVAKIYEPDMAQNIVPIYDSGQGIGKSVFVQSMCPLPKLFIEKSIDPGNKDFDSHLVNNFIWEIPELGAMMRKADREALKAFLTAKQVTFRPPYARKAIQKPATASFIGTVNSEGALLSDPTGHRRFFPIEIKAINYAYRANVDIDQVWAQATAQYKAGQTWRLSPEETAVQAMITQAYEVEDILESMLYKWFDIAPDNEKTFTATIDIVERLRLKADVRDSDKVLMMRLSSALKHMGLTRVKRMVNGRRTWGYAGVATNFRTD
jgi:hypothetical protein